MSTFGEVIDRIADDLNRTDMATQIKKAVNRSVIYYEKEPFWFKETSGSFSLSASLKSYGTANGLPADIKRIQHVEIAQSGTKYPLEEKDISWIQERNPDDATGVPSYYAWWQNKIWFSLVPNSGSLVATIYYTKKYDEMTATATGNDWTAYAEDLIESRARWWIFTRLQGTQGFSEPTKAIAAKQEEIDALEALRSKNEDYAAGMKVTPTFF